MGIFNIQKVGLTDQALKDLEIVKKLDRNIDHRPVKDIQANDTLEQMKKILVTIKEQNDEIIGDEF